MITCDQSDYLEIACLYRILIALNWPDGRRVEGIPLDTEYNEQREECLLMPVGSPAAGVYACKTRSHRRCCCYHDADNCICCERGTLGWTSTDAVWTENTRQI